MKKGAETGALAPRASNKKQSECVEARSVSVNIQFGGLSDGSATHLERRTNTLRIVSCVDSIKRRKLTTTNSDCCTKLMGMLYANRRAESLEQQTRKQQQQRIIRNDEKWHIRGEYFVLHKTCMCLVEKKKTFR